MRTSWEFFDKSFLGLVDRVVGSCAMALSLVACGAGVSCRCVPQHLEAIALHFVDLLRRRNSFSSSVGIAPCLNTAGTEEQPEKGDSRQNRADCGNPLGTCQYDHIVQLASYGMTRQPVAKCGNHTPHSHALYELGLGQC